ncbi:MAG: hypothetical protein RLY40_1027 [Pseudomonadota bacterium]|jgi:hypothetical protein
MLSKFYRSIKTQPIIHLFKQILTTEWHNKNNASAYLSSRKKIHRPLLLEEGFDVFSISNKETSTTLFFEYFQQQPLKLCKNNQENFTQEKNPQAERKPIGALNSLNYKQESGNTHVVLNSNQCLSTELATTTAIALLTEILSHDDLDTCYRAELYPKSLEKSADILLRESTTFPPSRAQQLKFNSLLADLTKEQLISFSADEIILPIRGTNDKKYHLPVTNIKIKDSAALEIRANAHLRETGLNTQETLESAENINNGRINNLKK